jgi:hypothetical protein
MNPRVKAASTGLFVLASLVAIASFLFVTFSRASYPFDLEWMEGGMITHAARVLRGEPIYAEPSVDFVPYFYTPLYSYVLAGLSFVAGGLSFGLARAVSIAASLGTMALVFMYVRRESTTAWGIVAAGVLAAHFRMSGAFADLARPDSLGLFFVVASFVVASRFPSARGALAAALLAVLAFFTKQTMAVFVPAIALGVALDDRKRAAIYAGVAFGVGAAAAVVVDAATSGWFRFYIVEGHQGHEFLWNNFLREYWRDVFFLSPALLIVPMAAVARDSWLRFSLLLGLPVVGVAIYARATELEFGPHMYYDEILYGADRRLVFAIPLVGGVLFALAAVLLRKGDTLPRSVLLLWGAGLVASCLNHSTQWAYANCFMPAVLGASFAVPLTLHRMLEGRAVGGRATAGAASLVLSFVFASAPLVYVPSAQVPDQEDKEAVAAFAAELSTLGDNVWVPAHPFAEVARGGRVYAHQMGLGDVGFEGGLVDLRRRLEAREWDAIVLDATADIPNLRADYVRSRAIRYSSAHAAMPRTGFETRPQWVWVPKR